VSDRSRTVYLLRHAKSSWKEAGAADHDRPLNERGRRAAARIGAHLASVRPQPGLVLCSSAQRARETWALVERELPSPPPLRVEPRLYLAAPSEILALLRELADDESCVLAVGHNPGMADLATRLAGRGDAAALERLSHKLPTGGLVELRFDGASWRTLAGGGAELVSFTSPKELESLRGPGGP
jgi:phosphohistidine phosphatase